MSVWFTNMPQLQVRQRGDVLKVVILEMRMLSLGRTPDNGLSLRDQNVAIRHAEISNEEGVFLLTALTSEQFLTFVNGQRLAAHQPHRLEGGDEIQIGSFTLTYLEEATPVNISRSSGDTMTVYGQLQAREAHSELPKYPSPLPPSNAPSLYLSFLPPLFQESELLSRYLNIFQAIWEPLQIRQDHLDIHFDPRLSPPAILEWMAAWLGVPIENHWPEARKRAWIREVVMLYRWRGTRYGLSRALETVYGLTPILKEDSAKPFTLIMEVTDSLDGEDSASREEITRFVYQHVPAHLLVEIRFTTTSIPPHETTQTIHTSGSEHS